MLPADSEDFSTALREAFPSIKFIRFPCLYTLRKTLGREELLPEDLSLFYCDSLAQRFEIDTPESRMWDSKIIAWLEPEGWEPFWIGPTCPRGDYAIANEPRPYFGYLGSRIHMRGGSEFLSEGFITSTFPKNDKKFRSFLNKVWRILGKLTTNVLTCIDIKRDLPYGPAERQFMGCCGLHALAWMREAPNRYVLGNRRPPEDGETGPYAPKPTY